MSENAKLLKQVGYWKSKYDKDYRYPEPQWLVQHGWHPEELDRIIAYLRSGHEYLAELGYSYCRFHDCSDECARNNGVLTLTDGEWLWPQGLAHYIEKHSVILPEEFISTMRSNHWRVPQPPDLPPENPELSWTPPRRQRRRRNVGTPSISFWLKWARKYGPWYLRLIFW